MSIRPERSSFEFELLRDENAGLRLCIEELEEQLKQRDTALAECRDRIQSLEGEHEKLKRMIFGKRSEKMPSAKLEIKKKR